MPGADLQMSVASVGDRGLRSPRHVGQIYSQQQRFLHPWMVAPVRPGETFVGASLQGVTWLNSIVNAVQAPLMWGEIGLWYIPLPALGDWFQRLISSTGQDAETTTNAVLTTNIPIGFAGDPNEPGAQNFNRPWAGEIAVTGNVGTGYIPYASRGTYKIGEDWYEISQPSDVSEDSRYDNPPFVGPYIRSMGRMKADLQGFADPDPSFNQSMAILLSQLHLLTSQERSYAEILAAHGVPPSRAGAMSVPLMLEHGAITPQSDPHFVYAGSNNTVLVSENNDDAVSPSYEQTMGGGRYGTTVQDDSDAGFIYSQRPMASFWKTWNSFRTKPMRIPDFGIIIGTAVQYQEFAGQGDEGHMFDAIGLVNGGMWGDRSAGGVEETDFMHVRSLADRGGGNPEQAILNALNLYLHGDVFNFGEIATGNPFAFRDPTGRGFLGNNVTDYTTKLSCQLHILSDLVGGG